MPLVTGTILPSGDILKAQPRNRASLVKEPVRQRAIHRFPDLSKREPKVWGRSSVLLAFGDHRLDIERRELRRGAQQIELEPKVFDLLAFLVRNRGRW